MPMWIFLPDAFLSVVANRERKNELLVRARLAGDLERAFARIGVQPGVTVTPRADYRYRTSVDRTTFLRLLEVAVQGITYHNFKNQVAHDDRLRHDAYFRVWESMVEAQGDAAARTSVG